MFFLIQYLPKEEVRQGKSNVDSDGVPTSGKYTWRVLLEWVTAPEPMPFPSSEANNMERGKHRHKHGHRHAHIHTDMHTCTHRHRHRQTDRQTDRHTCTISTTKASITSAQHVLLYRYVCT